jgi:hypothetical protein
MNLNTLITCPPDTKLFIDLCASACFVRDHHPDFSIDIFVTNEAIPTWWSSPGNWLNIIFDLNNAKPPYALIIQTTPEQTLADQLLTIEAENRAGVTSQPNLHIQGRWAQTLIATFGCTRFSPFTPFDLFNHVLLGRTTIDFAPRNQNQKGLWVIDLDSLPPESRSWGETMISQISLTHPGQVRDKLLPSTRPQDIACYIGGQIAAASWFSYFGSKCALVSPKTWESKFAPAHPSAWVLDRDNLPAHKVLFQMMQGNETRVGSHFRHTTEFLGGQLPSFSSDKVDSSEQIFDRLNYVVINYLNDLLEVDIPIPDITSECCLKLKGTQAVFTKLIHLNQFAIKFLQEFNDKHTSGLAKESDVIDLTNKMAEIDEITNKTMAVYHEMDLLKLWIHFSKAGAQGENVIDIAKSLILIYYEINQAMEAYIELTDSIVQQHGRNLADTRP